LLYLAGLASSIYLPGISGAATSPRWAILALIPWFLRGQRATIAHWVSAAFVLWAALTMAWNPAPLDGVGALFPLLIGAACFCLGDQLFEFRPIWIGAAIGIGFSSAAAIAQTFGFTGIEGLMPVHGLFVNANYMAEAAGLVLVAVLAERLWWCLPCVLPALLLGQGRGGIVAAAAPFILKYRRQPLVLAGAAAALVLVIGYASFMKGQDSTTERLLIWQSALHGVNVFGHGIGSFWTQYPAFDLRINPPGNPETAHNELLTAAFETGIVGAALLTAFFAILAIGPLTTERMVLIATLVEACFAFPFHLPTTAFLGLVAAGGCVWSAYLVRDVAYGRGNHRGHWRANERLPTFRRPSLAGAADYAVRPSVPRISNLKGAV
jgi:hypothetical protein